MQRNSEPVRSLKADHNSRGGEWGGENGGTGSKCANVLEVWRVAGSISFKNDPLYSYHLIAAV